MNIFAHRLALGLLDGEYASVFRGRSLDFDELRAYVPGDEVRDIDWKATARTGVPLVKRYVATRRQQVMFVADTGRNMAAAARGGEVKKDIAVLAMGVLGSLALNHGDPVGLVHGDRRSAGQLPARGNERHLERLLCRMDAVDVSDPPSDLTAVLEYTARHVRGRRLVVVLADEVAVDARCARVLCRLAAQHEILWVQLDDAELAGPGAPARGYDVAGLGPVLTLLAQDPKLADDYAQAVAQRHRALAALLQGNGIALVRLGHTSEVVGGIFGLLERHRRAR
ncbi:DUF58 domain-containing protein [Arthrobacter livingstonensis]|uniref:DUF58 domain-containing protein n=1 Tax=Arthrobacter livingstonensis TaxID=670078 RepID=A0A2V5L7R4_9MICC|nr:DUF58 domain-containing protein [Arthrobacter livingstonensis]PYI67535.1 DUF58 domain-containing protein [Arthrobacter livingstonensis]